MKQQMDHLQIRTDPLRHYRRKISSDTYRKPDMQRQQTQNLVYWPQKSITSDVTSMAHEKLKTGDTQQWVEHMRAVADRQDKAAFHALYCFFAPKVKSFYAQHGFYNQSDGMVQEVFMRVWKRAPTYNASKSAVSTWIYTIARNYRIDVLRKKQIPLTDDESAPESGYHHDLGSEVTLERKSIELGEAIASLNTEQRMVIQKVYFEDKSQQVAAKELGMTLGVVKSRIRSALKLMKKQMGDEWL